MDDAAVAAALPPWDKRPLLTEEQERGCRSGGTRRGGRGLLDEGGEMEAVRTGTDPKDCTRGDDRRSGVAGWAS